MKYRVIAVLSLLFFSLSSSAADYTVSVCKIQIGLSGKAYLSPCGGWPTKNQCTANNWLTWDANTKPGQMMYSTALAATAANKKITLRLNGAVCDHYDVTSMIRFNI